MKAALACAALLLFTAPPARADDEVLAAEDAALLASEVQAEYCSDVAATDPEKQALAIERAAPAYGKVAAAYRTHGDPFLLYWRAMLADCLSKEDQAQADYTAFLEAIEGNSAYAPQISDARRRLRRLERGGLGGRSGPTDPELGPPVVIAIGGGVLAGVGASMHGGSYAGGTFDVEAGTWTGTQEEYDLNLGVNRAGFGLLVGGGAAAAAGIVAAVVRGTSGDRRRSSVGFGVAFVPTVEGGGVLVIGGTL